MKDEKNPTLTSFREAAKLTQTELAGLMGLGLSAYQDLESGFSKFKAKHLMVVERVSLKLAVERSDLNLALPGIRRDALDLGRLMTGEDASGLSSEDLKLTEFLGAVRKLITTSGIEVMGKVHDYGFRWKIEADDNGRRLVVGDFPKGQRPSVEHVADMINSWVADTVA